MSVKTYIAISCDKCGETYDGGEGEKARSIRKTLRTLRGWKLTREKDFCDKCRKDIEAAVREAKAGNLGLQE